MKFSNLKSIAGKVVGSLKLLALPPSNLWLKSLSLIALLGVSSLSWAAKEVMIGYQGMYNPMLPQHLYSPFRFAVLTFTHSSIMRGDHAVMAR